MELIFWTGCRECVQQAGNTFVMDEAMGSARVCVQYGDSEHDIEVHCITILPDYWLVKC